MKTAAFDAGNHRSELNSPLRSQTGSTFQDKRDVSLFSDLQKKVDTIRTAFNTIINSAIAYKPADNRYRARYSGRTTR